MLEVSGTPVQDVAIATIAGLPGCNMGGGYVRAGDLDGDGHDDLVVAPRVDGYRQLVAVFRGPITSDLALPDADLVWVDPYEEGRSVANVAVIPDTDGDGLPELAIGSLGSAEARNKGVVYLVPGTGSGRRWMSDGLATVHGAVDVERLGEYAIHGADLTDDGVGDLILSVTTNTGGILRVIPGPISGELNSDEQGFRILEVEDGRWWGIFRAATGDFDGDGDTDLVVTSRGSHATTTDAMVFEGPLTEDTASTARTVTIDGITSLQVLSLGDVSGDGIDDLAFWKRGVLSTYDPPQGAVWIHHGPFTAPRDLWTDAVSTITSDSDAFPTSLSVRIDLGADGRRDLLAGVDMVRDSSMWHGTVEDGTGGAFLFQLPLASSLLDVDADEVIVGNHATERFGASVAAVGDLDSDGIDDLVVAAAAEDPATSSEFSAGVAHIVSGASLQ